MPSRWLNRITGLLGGIGPEGAAALAAMRDRGRHWVATAALLDAPDGRYPADPRPPPRRPPAPGHRAERLSVTGVETLIRDPYAIYARQILSLHALDPLRQGPDARLRGFVVHAAMERFAQGMPGALPEDAAALLRTALGGPRWRKAPPGPDRGASGWASSTVCRRVPSRRGRAPRAGHADPRRARGQAHLRRPAVHVDRPGGPHRRPRRPGRDLRLQDRHPAGAQAAGGISPSSSSSRR